MTQTNLFTELPEWMGKSPYSRPIQDILIQDTGIKVVIFKGASIGFSETARPIHFDGEVTPDLDNVRLTGQLLRIYELMKCGSWFSLGEIAKITEDPESSVSAQLRNFRKERFGSQTVNRRRRGEEKTGLWEYQLIINKPIKEYDGKNNSI